jgi:hypothetical protein
MKKIVYAFILAIALFWMIPMSSYAGHSGVYVGTNIRMGYPGYGGHYGGWGWHRPYPVWGGPGFYWGGSIVVGPPWYPYGYYAAPPTVIQQEPQTYVHPEQPQENYWYYCQNPQGYYPYVQSCPGGWMKVVPQPAPPKQ